MAAGCCRDPPSLHVATWQEPPATSNNPVTWERSTELLTRLLASDMDIAPAQPQKPGQAENPDPTPIDMDVMMVDVKGEVEVEEETKQRSRSQPPKMALSLDGSTCAVAWLEPVETGSGASPSHMCLLATDSMKVTAFPCPVFRSQSLPRSRPSNPHTRHSTLKLQKCQCLLAC